MRNWTERYTTRHDHFFASLLTGLAWLLLAGVFVALPGIGFAASTVPFTDDFDSYTNGTNLDGSNGWTVVGSGTATATNGQAEIINTDTNVTFYNAFSDSSSSVSVAFDLQPTLAEGMPVELIPDDATFVFYVGTNGMVTAYDGATPSNLTHTAISDAYATNFLVTLDYASSNWNLYVGGAQIVDEFAFYTNSHSGFTELAFLEPAATSYVDNVDIKAPPLVYFDVASAVYEEGVSVTVTARLSSTFSEVVTVQHALTGGGTGTGADITSYSAGTLTFDIGSDQTNFTFTVYDDDVGEDLETLIFGLTDPTNGVLGSPATFTLSIPDDTTDWSLPFSDDFESPRQLADLSGQNGWQATDAHVQDTTYLDAQAAAVTSANGVASHPFDGTETSVWTDLRIQPVFGDHDSTNPPAGSSFAFFVNSSSNVVVYDGAATQTLAGVTVAEGEWVRFTVYSDYANTNWDLYVDGVLATNDVGFYTNTPASYTEFGVRGGGSSSVPFDNVNISTNPPAPFVFFTAVSNTYDEGSTATGRVALSWAAASSVTVDVIDLGTGTATGAGDEDYTFSSPSNITFAAGTTNMPFTFPITQDVDGENAETILFELGNFSGCEGGDPTNFTATIDIDPADVPEISFDAAAATVAESTGVVTVTVQVNVPYNIDTVKVDYAASGTATLDVDYTNYADGTLILDPGQTATNFTFEVIDDLVVEGDETVIFGMDNFVNSSAGTHTQITYTIESDVGDVQPDVYLATATDSVAETAGSSVQTVYLSKIYNGTVMVDVVDTGAGSATGAGSDYTFTPATLTFVPGDTNETFSVTITDDSDADNDETAVFELTNAASASIVAPSNLTLTITGEAADFPPEVYFAAPASSVAEADVTVTQTVYLTKTWGSTVTVDVVDSGTGSATGSGTDYSFVTAALSFDPGSTSDTFVVSIVDDTAEDSSQTVDFGFANFTNCSAGTPSSHTLTITPDYLDWSLPFTENFNLLDTADLASQNGWQGQDAVVQEDVTYAASAKAGAVTTTTGRAYHQFTAVETNVWTDLFIQPVFDDGSTTNPPAGATFAFFVNAASNVVVYNGGSMETTTATVVQDAWARFTVNSDYEAETWDLYLDGTLIAEDRGFINSASAYTEFGLISGAGSSNTPVDDVYIATGTPTFLPPRVSFDPIASSYAEGIGTATGTVVLSWGYDGTAEVDVVTLAGGTATGGGTDYTYGTQTLAFAALQTTQTFTFAVNNDNLGEPAETIFFGLANYTNCSAGDETNFTATIDVDQADVPDLSFEAATASYSETAGVVTVNVNLSATYGGTVTAHHGLAATGTTAGSPSDYTYTPGSLSFAPGATNDTFTFTVVNDTDMDFNEQIVFALTDIVNADPGVATNLTVTIEEDLADSTLPFVETFEDLSLSSLYAQHGWRAEDAVVQNTLARNSTKAGSITSATGRAYHQFGDEQTGVWTELYIQPEFGSASPTNIPDGSSFVFYVNASSNVVAYNGTNEVELGTTVSTGVWTRFTVYSDYNSKTYDLYVNHVKPAAAENYGFYDTNATYYTEFGVIRAGESDDTELDNIRIAPTAPLDWRDGSLFRFR